jgi:hypothetical protein
LVVVCSIEKSCRFICSKKLAGRGKSAKQNADRHIPSANQAELKLKLFMHALPIVAH